MNIWPVCGCTPTGYAGGGGGAVHSLSCPIAPDRRLSPPEYEVWLEEHEKRRAIEEHPARGTKKLRLVEDEEYVEAHLDDDDDLGPWMQMRRLDVDRLTPAERRRYDNGEW